MFAFPYSLSISLNFSRFVLATLIRNPSEGRSKVFEAAVLFAEGRATASPTNTPKNQRKDRVASLLQINQLQAATALAAGNRMDSAAGRLSIELSADTQQSVVSLRRELEAYKAAIAEKKAALEKGADAKVQDEIKSAEAIAKKLSAELSSQEAKVKKLVADLQQVKPTQLSSR